MHKVEDIVSVASQLMAADIPALGRELQTQLNFSQPVASLVDEKCDAYVWLADKLLSAVDRWYAKQTPDKVTLTFKIRVLSEGPLSHQQPLKDALVNLKDKIYESREDAIKDAQMFRSVQCEVDVVEVE